MHEVTPQGQPRPNLGVLRNVSDHSFVAYRLRTEKITAFDDLYLVFLGSGRPPFVLFFLCDVYCTRIYAHLVLLRTHPPLPYDTSLVCPGSIPPWIGAMTSLEDMDLSAMQLGGEWTICGITAPLAGMPHVSPKTGSGFCGRQSSCGVAF